MKVLKTKRDESWRKAIDCPKCESSLEIEASDVYMDAIGSGMDNFNSAPVYLVDCVVCNRFIQINKDWLPEWVQRERKSAKKPKS